MELLKTVKRRTFWSELVYYVLNIGLAAALLVIAGTASYIIYDKKKKKWHVIGITHARKMDYIKAFLIGGLICAAVQILLDRTKLMPGRVMVLLVCTGAVLGFIGAYEPFVKFSGAGASVPLLGFGNVLWKGVKEAVDKNGFLGIFLGGFKASAAGISAALIFGYLASLIFEPKMKK